MHELIFYLRTFKITREGPQGHQRLTRCSLRPSGYPKLVPHLAVKARASRELGKKWGARGQSGERLTAGGPRASLVDPSARCEI